MKNFTLCLGIVLWMLITFFLVLTVIPALFLYSIESHEKWFSVFTKLLEHMREKT